MTKPELEVCINEYGTDIYSFCKYLTQNRQEAEDLYQDTFLKVMELDDKLDAGKNPKSYLLAVALRIWKNRKRKYAWRKRIVDVQFLADGQEDGVCAKEGLPEEQLLCEEEKEAVRKAVAKLPERLLAIVLLYYMEGLSVAQVAAVAKLPEGTVKSRLHQARKLLRKELEVVLNEKRYG